MRKYLFAQLEIGDVLVMNVVYHLFNGLNSTISYCIILVRMFCPTYCRSVTVLGFTRETVYALTTGIESVEWKRREYASLLSTGKPPLIYY